ncbi:2Fe-2S iron-sulfur cluster-binding protein [Rhodococcus sp. NPDC057014]|uniref:2Fe-2S iron-sulfur cluster-binding protein n=1 Tax=Rhodococcus sp. NPDC057014 TaxID=3346000 RepID=UPI00364353CC
MKLHYIEDNGQEHIVDAELGTTVMSTAVTNGIPGIDAQCGGSLSCASCHVYVEAPWQDNLAPAGDEESEMLESAAAEVRPNSRLSCQLELGPDLDGLTVRIPETQW